MLLFQYLLGIFLKRERDRESSGSELYNITDRLRV